MQIFKNKKGTLSTVALGVVIALVALFMGLYMVSKVADVASINNTSDFKTPYDNLVTNTSTIFDVMVLVIIITALGLGIAVLRGFSSGGDGPQI